MAKIPCINDQNGAIKLATSASNKTYAQQTVDIKQVFDTLTTEQKLKCFITLDISSGNYIKMNLVRLNGVFIATSYSETALNTWILDLTANYHGYSQGSVMTTGLTDYSSSTDTNSMSLWITS